MSSSLLASSHWHILLFWVFTSSEGLTRCQKINSYEHRLGLFFSFFLTTVAIYLLVCIQLGNKQEFIHLIYCCHLDNEDMPKFV